MATTSITAEATYGLARFFVDEFGIPHMLYDGFDVIVTRSEMDGVRVIVIDTQNVPENEHGPLCRIALNDTDIFENPAYNAQQENDHAAH